MNLIKKSLIISGSLTGVCLILFIKHLKRILNLKKIIFALEHEIQPEKLKNLLDTLNDKILNRFQKQDDCLVSNSYMITGLLDTNHPQVSKYNKQQKYIFLYKLFQPKSINYDYILNNQLDTKNQYKIFDQFKDACQIKPFFLKDFLNPNSICHVQSQEKNIRFIDKLDLVYQFYKPHELGSIEKFFAFLSKFLFGIYSIFGIRSFQGIEVGYYENQYGNSFNPGLKVGSVASVLGTIIYNTKTKSLEIKNPFVILDNPQNFKTYLKSVVTKNKIVASLFLVLMYIFIHIFNKQFRAYNKIYHQNLKTQKIESQNLSRIDSKFQQVEELKCMVCYVNTRSIILKPCMHLCICQTCLDNLPKQNCIICRHETKGYIDIFVHK